MSKKKDVGKGIRALLSNIENNQNPEDQQKSIKQLIWLSAFYLIVVPKDTDKFIYILSQFQELHLLFSRT